MESGSIYRYGSDGHLSVTVTGHNAGFWHDFKTGKSGRLVALAQQTLKCGFREALKYSAEYAGVAPTPQEGREAEQTQIKGFSELQKEKMAYAAKLAEESMTAEGTVAERYLRACGLTGAIPASFRFHSRVYESETKKAHPALLAVADNQQGQVQSVECVFLEEETARPLNVAIPKRNYGPGRGAVVLVQQGATDKVALASGFETALSIAEDKELSVYAAFGLAHCSEVPLPTKLKAVYLCTDNHSHTSQVINETAALLSARGLAVWQVQPPAGVQDLNALLKEGGVAAIQQAAAQATLIQPAVSLEQDVNALHPWVVRRNAPLFELHDTLREYQKLSRNTQPAAEALEKIPALYQAIETLMAEVMDDPLLLESAKRYGVKTALSELEPLHVQEREPESVLASPETLPDAPAHAGTSETLEPGTDLAITPEIEPDAVLDAPTSLELSVATQFDGHFTKINDGQLGSLLTRR